MRTVVKGLNYTEVRTFKKGFLAETVQHWSLKKLRQPKDCGVWINGKQTNTFETMEKNVEGKT